MGTGMRRYDSEDGTREKKSTVLRSVLTNKPIQPREQETVDLDANESEAERVAKLLAHLLNPVRHQADGFGPSRPFQRPQNALISLEVKVVAESCRPHVDWR